MLKPWERILLAKLADNLEEEASSETETDTTAEVIPLPQPDRRARVTTDKPTCDATSKRTGQRCRHAPCPDLTKCSTHCGLSKQERKRAA